MKFKNKFILLFICLMLFPFPFEWYVYQFILINVVLIPIVAFNKNDAIQFVPKIDIYFSLFIVLSFMSVLWAINLTLVWGHAFGWLLFFLWFLVFRSYILRKDFDFISKLLFYFFVGCSIYIISVVILKHIITESPWHQYFGNNSNNISVLASMSIPFVFYGVKNGKMEFCIKAFSIIAILYCVTVASSISVLAAVLFVIPILIILEYFSISVMKKYLILGFYSIMSISLFRPLVHLFKLDELASFQSRLLLTEVSLNSFLSNPFVGVGLGNWEIIAFSNGIPLDEFNFKTSILTIENHNLFTNILVELGLLGCMFYFIPIAIILISSLSNFKGLRALEKSAFFSIIIYLYTSLFYKSNHIDDFFFSKPEFLFFTCLSILSVHFLKMNESIYTK